MKQSSAATLAELRNAYAGRRCFVIGNGPSLNRTDLGGLKDEITIGMNRIYLKFAEIGFATSFLCCDNALVLRQFGDDLLKLPSTLFLSSRAGRRFEDRDNLHWMDSLPGAGFNADLSNGAWYSGATVTFCSLQLAYYLGCTDVILLGVDHNFVTKGTAHKSITSAGDDPNHFDGSYFGKGTKWQLPDLVESEASYSLARAMFEASGRQIRDATVGGKLTIFQKASLKTEQSEVEVVSIDAVASPTNVAPPVAGDSPARIAAFEFLNGEDFSKVVFLGVGMLLLGIACFLWILGPLLGLQILGSVALIVAGLLGITARFAVPAAIEGARRRRLKDSRLLRNSIEAVIAAKSEDGGK